MTRAPDSEPTLEANPESVLGRLRIGVVLPAASLLDYEYSELAGRNRHVYISRTDHVYGDMGHGRATALSSTALVVPAVQRLLPVEPHVVAFACTAGSFAVGDEGERTIARAMLEAGASSATTTSGALRSLLMERLVSRIAVSTPYSEALTQGLVSFLGEHDIEVSSVHSRGLRNPREVANINPETLSEMVDAVADSAAEAIFLSCTNLPTVGQLDRLSARAGKPVLSANLVTVWGALEEAGDRQGAAALIDSLWTR